MIETKELGKTGVKVPAIGMGTWEMGGWYTPYYAEDGRAIRALKAGIEWGLTFIDTAEMYGGGHSEELVGKAIKGMRERVFIATKVLPHHLTYQGVLQAVEGSLRRLGIDHIDLYQVHAPNPRIPMEEWLKAMERLVMEGKVRFIGVSNFSVEEMREAQRQSIYPLVSNQVEYNLLVRNIERDLLPLAQREGISIIAYRPLAKGSLPHYSGRGRKVLQEMAQKYHKSISQICLNWLISKEPVIAIPKAIDIEHIKENLGAMGWRMKPEDYELLEQAF